MILLLFRHYVVTSPAVFYHPYSATLWVHLINVHQPTQVTIQLQRADGAGNITLLERKVEEPQLLLNVTFPVSVTSGCPVHPIASSSTEKWMGAGLISSAFGRGKQAKYLCTLTVFWHFPP